MSLITAEEISEAWVRIAADWPRGRLQELYRLVKDTLHDCETLAEAHESAARQRAKSALPMVADIYADLRSGRAFGIPQDDGAASVTSKAEPSSLSVVAAVADPGSHCALDDRHDDAVSLDEPARLREGGAL